MITVATSIAPFNLENQYTALKTWSSAGFEVISCNSPSEIKQIAPQFPFVNFVAVTDFYSPALNKAYIYITDILKALQASEAQVCCVVNSDIYLSDAEAFKAELVSLDDDTALCAHRKDVNDLNDPQGEFYLYGFDVFCFRKQLTKIFDKSPFCLGMTGWDYWVPFVLLKQGKNLRHIKSSEFLHIRHPLNYDFKSKMEFTLELVRFVDERIYNKVMAVLQSKSSEDYLLMPIFVVSFINAVYYEFQSYLNGEFKAKDFFSELKKSPQFRLALMYLSKNFFIEDYERFKETFMRFVPTIRLDTANKKHFLETALMLLGTGRQIPAYNAMMFYKEYIEDNDEVIF